MTTQKETRGTVGRLLTIGATVDPIVRVNFKLKDSEYQDFKAYCESNDTTMTELLRAFVISKIDSQ